MCEEHFRSQLRYMRKNEKGLVLIVEPNAKEKKHRMAWIGSGLKDHHVPTPLQQAGLRTFIQRQKVKYPAVWKRKPTII